MNTSAPQEPRATRVDFVDGEMVVHLEDGRSLHVPLEWFSRLRDASAAELSDWRLIGRGIGIHWPQLDEDLSIRALLLPRIAERKSA